MDNLTTIRNKQTNERTLDKKSRKSRRMVSQLGGSGGFDQQGSSKEGKSSTFSQATKIYNCKHK